MGKLLALVGTGVVATVIAGCAPPPAGDLGIGGDYSEATSVNASGYIAGFRQQGAGQTAFLRKPDGDVVDPFPGMFVYGPVFVTGDGAAVAYTFPPDCPPPSCGETSRRTPDGRVATFPSSPVDVNDRGDVVTIHGGIWRADGTHVDLPSSGGLSGTGATAIDGRGDVFGRVEADGERGAQLVRWDGDDGELHVLVQLPLGHSLTVEDVNGAGEVLGTVGVPGVDGSVTVAPVVWRTARTPVVRVELHGADGTIPVAINDRGVVIANQFDALGGTRAVYWPSAASEWQSLGGPASTFGAFDINTPGLVVGTTRAADGRVVAAAYQIP